jgi:hypothetical protein
MGLCFARHGGAEARAADEAARRVVRDIWACLEDSSSRVELCLPQLRALDGRLGLEADPAGNGWRVTYDELSARGAAEWVADLGPVGRVAVGRPALPWRQVERGLLESLGAEVAAARVRAGFTRGHALEVVVSLPPSGPEPQIVAERLVEGLLGEATTDDWIAAVDVAALPRPGGLPVLQAGVPAGETHPAADLPVLLERAVAAVDALLPPLPRHALEVGAEWTLLEMPPDPASPQPDRVSAATCLPELLKCALEGLPLHSRRFSRWGESFLWLKVPASRAERVARREQIERTLDERLRAESAGALVGTGFGAHYDYFDLCLSAGEASLLALLRAARSSGLGRGTELGFYDSRWAEERLSL